MHDKQVALVTGANKGIGLETARQLARRGMTALVGARAPERGEEAAQRLRAEGLDARFVRLDVTEPASIAEAARWIETNLGRLDVLVNNAGVLIGTTKPSETNLDELRSLFQVNVFGTIAVTQAMLPLLRRARPAARIVNVSSGTGSLTQSSDPRWEHARINVLAYPAAKAALNMATVQFAKELRETGIKVNAADPGYTATDMTRHHGQPVEEGARASVWLATLDEGGPTGGFFDAKGPVPW
ncbi:SDR family oxidoreductase [Sorangium sp. So ce131]|uniref:SDR family oxidoreductase n=1 Tax=Sorangium sp. So ce131 TaxID=3133282 RepID=UPI003F60B462